MAIRIILCRGCNKPFEVKGQGRIVYCPECSKSSIERKLTCEFCAKQFIQIVAINRLNLKKPKRFCSNSCKNKFEHANGTRRNYMIDEQPYERWLRKFGKEEADRRRAISNEKLSETNRGDNNRRWGKNHHTADQIEIQRQKLKANPNSIVNRLKGRKLEDVYGVEKAALMRVKCSKRMSGSGNPMYGKPAPKKCGIGWKGYYRGLFFRSLLELAFMLKMAELNQKIKTAETNECLVNYALDGVARTYRPDFITENGSVFEVKPSALTKTTENMAKFAVAIKRWPNFTVVTEKDLQAVNRTKLKNLIDLGEVKLTLKTLEKFNAFLGT